MPRTNVESDYHVEGGVIVSSGKFEGEAVYVPHYWDIGLDGFSDEDTVGADGWPVYVFDLTDEDRSDWPELGDAVRLEIVEDDSGFVRGVLS